MRKLLLGTSALIGATALVASASAAAPELTVSGNLNFQWVGGEGQATLSNGGGGEDLGVAESGWEFDQANSLSEIKFHAEGESDGGTTYGAQIDYRYLANDADESYIFISGDWGTVHLGNDDGAVDQTKFYAGSIAPGGYLIDGWATSMGYVTNGTSDNNKILYVSNDLSGFKFAISVTEAQAGSNQGGAVTTFENAIDGGVVTAGPPRSVAAPADNAPAATAAVTRAAITAFLDASSGRGLGSRAYEDVYEIGASYTAGFDGGHLGISVGYLAADAADHENGRGVAVTGADEDADDLAEYVIGLKAGSGPFSFAASYADEDDSGLTNAEKTAGAEGRELYTIGVAYDLGGGMAVGVSYAEAEETLATAGGNPVEVEESLTAIDFGFPIMAGMSGYAGIAFSEVDANVTTTGSGTGAAATGAANGSKDGTTYVIGTTVSF